MIRALSTTVITVRSEVLPAKLPLILGRPILLAPLPLKWWEKPVVNCFLKE
jgi:hypothetical protein